MHFALASPAAQQNPLALVAYLARRSVFLDLHVLPLDLFVLNSPQMVDQQAEVMSEVMWGAISHCSNHQSLLSRPIADVAVPSLALFFVGRPSEPASMASILHLLTVLVDPDGALRTLLYGVAHFRKVAEAGRARRPQVVLGAFVEFRLFVKDIFFKVSKSKNPVEFLFVKPVVFVVFNGFVIVKEVYWGLKEGLAQVFDNEDLDVLVLKIAVCWADLKLAVLQEVFLIEALPHLLEDFVLELVADLAKRQYLQLYIFERHITIAQLFSERIDKPLHYLPDFRPPMVQVVLIGTQKPEVFEVPLPRFIISELSQQ